MVVADGRDVPVAHCTECCEMDNQCETCKRDPDPPAPAHVRAYPAAAAGQG